MSQPPPYTDISTVKAYDQPPPAYSPTYGGQYVMPNTPVVLDQPPTVTVFNVTTFSSQPTTCRCPYCHADIITSTRYEIGMLTWLISGVLCLAGCGLVSWIPCFIDDTKDIIHSCPQCQKIIGVHARM